MPTRLVMAGLVWLMIGCGPATNASQASSSASPTSRNVAVTFTGAVSGTIAPRAGFEPSCQLPFQGEVPKEWVYRVLGTVGVYHDVAFEIGVDDYGQKGPATSTTFESTGNRTLVVNADELPGTIDATLRPYPTYSGGIVSDTTLHVQGPFTCQRL